jgi:hypothetical protein
MYCINSVNKDNNSQSLNFHKETLLLAKLEKVFLTYARLVATTDYLIKKEEILVIVILFQILPRLMS